MIKFITGFKTKKQLIDVIKILQKKKVTYAFKDDVKLKEKIDRVWAQFKIKDDEKLKLAIHIWDFYVSDDKTRDVFSFVHQTKKHPNTITATKFIEQNLSAPYIVLKELMRAWGEGEGTPRHKFKEMLV